MKIKKAVCCAGLMLLLCSCRGNEPPSPPEASGNFDVAVLKAGQADAIILQTENHSVIIDCGERDDGGKVVKYLADKGISEVDYMFITHFDKDHVGGFGEIAESIKVKSIMVPDYEGQGGEYKKYVKALEENSLSPNVLTKDIAFVLDDVLLEVSVPQKSSYAEGDNDFSLVISATHGENSFLFAGDAEAERLSELLGTPMHEYDFLKVPHHGRYNEVTETFLSAVRPAYSVICDSQKNPAEEETVAALEALGSAVYRTKDGTVLAVSDGHEIKITQ